MGSHRRKRVVPSRRTDLRPSPRFNWPIAVTVAIALLFLIGFVARLAVRRGLQAKTVSRSDSAPAPASLSQKQLQSGTLYTDAEINAAANRLFAAVNPSLLENSYFTPFAKEKILWIADQRKAGKLSFILLKNIADTDLSFEAIMASARPEGKPVIIIARPRFIEFLTDGGFGSVPFTLQQRNDFALSLVHEVVHLENPNLGTATTFEDHLAEEQRAWRAVDLNVVREFRRLNEPMNVRFVDADDAIRTCHDRLPCEPLRALLLPTESKRF